MLSQNPTIAPRSRQVPLSTGFLNPLHIASSRAEKTASLLLKTSCASFALDKSRPFIVKDLVAAPAASLRETSLLVESCAVIPVLRWHGFSTTDEEYLQSLLKRLPHEPSVVSCPHVSVSFATICPTSVRASKPRVSLSSGNITHLAGACCLSAHCTS